MRDVVITGTGMHTPSAVISNEELVNSFNAYVDKYNHDNKKYIEKGTLKAKPYSDVAFIEKASGIKSRHVIEKEGILDIDVMHPRIHERPDDELCFQAEMGVEAAKGALQRAVLEPHEIDAIIVASSSFQRAYPAIAIEVQHALGAKGFAFDMNVACATGTFAIRTGESLIKSGAANKVLVISSELVSGITNYRNRDSHFIFGDAATALVLEAQSETRFRTGFKILATTLETMFSNNIRSNVGYLDRLLVDTELTDDRLFSQQGRKVFREVSKAVLVLLRKQADSLDITPKDLKRLWLHQANINMNRFIAKKFLGEEPDNIKAPIILDKYANTGSAGSLIAFHLHHEDFKPKEKGLLCAFGAGYSIGSILLERVGD